MLNVEIHTDNIENSKEMDKAIAKIHDFVNTLGLNKEKVMEFDDLLGEVLGQAIIDYTHEGVVAGVNFARK